MNLIQILEQEEIARLNKTLPSFAPGDTVIVQVKVKEGNRERLQAFEGVVIAKKNRGLNSAFTVRKISAGMGVERTFQTYSPLVVELQVKRRGDVRRTTSANVPASPHVPKKSCQHAKLLLPLLSPLNSVRHGAGQKGRESMGFAPFFTPCAIA